MATQLVGDTPLVLDADVVEERELNADVSMNELGHHVDTIVVDVPVGTTLRLLVDSAEFDTTLTVQGPDGLYLFNDDWNGTNSMVQFQSEGEGLYTVRVSSYAPGETGKYTLRAATFSPANISPTALLGDTFDANIVEGAGGPGDPANSSAVWFDVRAGQRIRLRVTSPDFDTTATLFSPSGDSWYNDDANDTGPDGSESNLDSTISAIAPTDGWYQLVVTPYGSRATGRFQVATSYEPPVTVAPDEEIPSMGYAGSQSAGQMFGLFVGITDYAPDDQLYGCADDATFLADAFRHRRLQSTDNQIVLTNRQATRAAFTDALRHIGEQAGPDDMVVIFYSGHGTVVDAVGDEELDGTDETLVFVDKQMRDNDFAALLDELEVDTILVAIDACNSGGFARDIMTQPGRIGLFSSDEDVLSATAEPVAAGGYLSYLMRQAVLGHADAHPRDGALLAGELGDFVIEGGVTHHRQMNPAGVHDPLQRMLIERGSFNWYDSLWVFPRNTDGSALGVEICLDSPPAGGSPAGDAGTCR